MSNLEVLDWTYQLQHKLDQLTQNEFEKFMIGKAIKLNGKLFILRNEENEKCEGKNDKINGKTNRSIKNSSRKSKTTQTNRIEHS